MSIVIFDSSVPNRHGQDVYMSAAAQKLADDEFAESIDIYSRRWSEDRLQLK